MCDLAIGVLILQAGYLVCQVEILFFFFFEEGEGFPDHCLHFVGGRRWKE